MNKCKNCIKENECKENGCISGYCGAYSPIKVTNKERLGIRSYEEAAIMLSDLFYRIKDSENISSLVLEWLQSN